MTNDAQARVSDRTFARRVKSLHMAKEGSLLADRDGWYWAWCYCGHKQGLFPDAEDAVDALMQHAREMGYLLAQKEARRA